MSLNCMDVTYKHCIETKEIMTILKHEKGVIQLLHCAETSAAKARN